MDIILQERTKTAEQYTSHIHLSLYLHYEKIRFPYFKFSDGYTDINTNSFNTYEYNFNLVVRYFSVEEINQPIYVQVCRYEENNYCFEWMTVNTISYINPNVILEEDIKFTVTQEGLIYIVSHQYFN